MCVCVCVCLCVCVCVKDKIRSFPIQDSKEWLYRGCGSIAALIHNLSTGWS